MSRGMESRVERLESQVNGEGLEGDLYDVDGERVTDARVVKWPTEQARGVAIIDGARREIAAKITLLDIIMERRRQAESGTDPPQRSEEERATRENEYRDLLFLRTDGKPDIMERILSKHHGRETERSGG